MRRPILLAYMILVASPLVAQAAGPEHPRADPKSLIDHPGPAATNLAGRWQVQGSLDDGSGRAAQASPVCDFQQTDRTLAGRCKGPAAEGPVSGVIAGKHIAWKWQASATAALGVSSVARFEGDLGADGVVRGTWSLDQLPGVKGPFTQTRK